MPYDIDTNASYEYVGDTIGVNADMKPGTVVTVREVVDADTPGAHDDSEDAVVIEWETPSLVTDENGDPQVGHVKRAMSFGVDRFKTDFIVKESE